MGQAIYDYNVRLMPLAVIQLSGGHCEESDHNNTVITISIEECVAKSNLPQTWACHHQDRNSVNFIAKKNWEEKVKKSSFRKK